MEDLGELESAILDKVNKPSWLPEEAYLVVVEKVRFWLRNLDGRVKQLPQTDEDWKLLTKQVQHYKPYLDLFTDERMQYCWRKINELNLNTNINNNVWLAEALWHSLPHMYSNPKTESETQTWKEEALKSLTTARNNLRKTPEAMSDFVSDFCNPSSEGLKKTWCYEIIDSNRLPYPWHILDFMIHTLDSTTHNNYFYGGNVNGHNAKRTYFINSLTCALLQDIGMPCRKLVQAATSVAFKCEIAERQIYRVTENLNHENHHHVVPSFVYTMTDFNK